MRPGFTLIELLVGIAISSMIAAAIFTLFDQVQRSARIADRLMVTTVPFFRAQQQLEKDISGAFIPRFHEGLIKKEQAQQAEQKKETAPKEGQKKEEKKQLEKVFVYKEDQKLLQELTFITCNPLQTYDNYKPRIVRVMYTVKKQENGLYELLRKEAPEIDMKAFDASKAPTFSILKNIKQCSFEWMYPKPEEKKTQEPAKAEQKEKSSQKKEIEYESTHEWPLKEDAKKELPLIPLYGVLTIICADPVMQAEDEVRVRYQIFAFYQRPAQAQAPAPRLEAKEQTPQQRAAQTVVRPEVRQAAFQPRGTPFDAIRGAR